MLVQVTGKVLLAKRSIRLGVLRDQEVLHKGGEVPTQEDVVILGVLQYGRRAEYCSDFLS